MSRIDEARERVNEIRTARANGERPLLRKHFPAVHERLFGPTKTAEEIKEEAKAEVKAQIEAERKKPTIALAMRKTLPFGTYIPPPPKPPTEEELIAITEEYRRKKRPKPTIAVEL